MSTYHVDLRHINNSDEVEQPQSLFEHGRPEQRHRLLPHRLHERVLAGHCVVVVY